jgi:hypothetical protein
MSIIWIGSPNYTQGRAGKSVDRIVIHWMVGTLAGTDIVFQNTTRGTSAHYGIEDSNIHQYVAKTDTAFHAGVLSMNQRSIGIEHSATPTRPATQMTVDVSAQLVADLCREYNIPCDRTHIIKHSEVPYATQCSGTIPIDEIVNKANKIIGDSMAEIIDRDTSRILISSILGYTGVAGRPDALDGSDLGDSLIGRALTPQLIKELFQGQTASEWRDSNKPNSITDINNRLKDSTSEYIKVSDLYIKK